MPSPQILALLSFSILTDLVFEATKREKKILIGVIVPGYHNIKIKDQLKKYHDLQTEVDIMWDVLAINVPVIIAVNKTEYTIASGICFA